jgi:hypothetical protein
LAAGEDHWYSADSDTEPESLVLSGSDRDQQGIITTTNNIPSSKDEDGKKKNSPNNESASVFGGGIGVNNVNGGSGSAALIPLGQRTNGNLYSNCGDINGSKMDIG